MSPHYNIYSKFLTTKWKYHIEGNKLNVDKSPQKQLQLTDS